MRRILLATLAVTAGCGGKQSKAHDKCGDVGSWHVCVDAVEHLSKLRDGSSDLPPPNGQEFLKLSLGITNKHDGEESPGSLGFDLMDANKTRTGQSEEASTALAYANEDTCERTDAVLPGQTRACVVIYAVKPGRPGLYLDVQDMAGHQARLGVGSR